MLVHVFLLAICTWNLSMGVPDSHTFRRDYTFDEQLGGWLKIHPMPSEWKDAALRCHYEGAILASPLNEEISKALFNVIVNRGMRNTAIFTGISNIYAKTEYQSMEGVPIENIWLSWAASPKVNPTDENCIVMNVLGFVGAVRCSDPHPFVCYRNKPFSEPNKCGTVDPDYILNEQTGSCYKVSNEKLTWSDAFKSCAIDGGHLAIINSKTEAEAVWESSKKHSRENSVLIGVRAWGARRAWITVHGQPLNECYSEWRNGEPNNADGNEYCVGIHVGDRIEGGIMNDVPCSSENHYICEIEPVIGSQE